MKVVIRESGAVLGNRIAAADTFFRRFKGLMLTGRLPDGEGLYIRPCTSVHTFFMKYAIDVLHLNEEGRIVGMESSLKPGKWGASIKGTRYVVELPAGTLEKARACIGQTVIFEEEINPKI